MTKPIRVEVPHRLGLPEARRRVDNGLGKLAGWIPGAAVVDHRWDKDVMTFTLSAMGQSVVSTLDVRADRIIATVDLPPFLTFFAEKIRAKLKKEAPRLLD